MKTELQTLLEPVGFAARAEPDLGKKPEIARILVVDSDFSKAAQLEQALPADTFEIIGFATDPGRAIELAQEDRPDIALMDVNILEPHDGIALAQKLKAIGNTAIIFLTAFDDAELLEKASVVAPAAYILKPFEPRNLIAAIRLAYKQLESDQSDEVYFMRDRIFIKDNARFHKLMLDDIRFVEAVGSYIDIFTTHKKLTLTVNLKQFAAKLNHPQFIRVHRSYLVNVDAIDSFEGHTIFIDSHQIPISAANKEFFLRSVRMI